MSESENPLTKIGVEIAKGAYGDVVRPSAQPTGEAISGIFKAVLHYPRYWARISEVSLEYKVNQFRNKLESGVEKIPLENRILPHPVIVGPSVQALEYSVIEDHLSDMFAKLLVTAMDERTVSKAHPAFVEIIKQLAPDEALIIKYLEGTDILPVMHVMSKDKDSEGHNDYIRNFSLVASDAKCSYPENGPQYLNNLVRLGIIEIPAIVSITDKSHYSRLLEEVEKIRSELGITEESDIQMETEEAILRVTALGKQFIAACVSEKL